MKILCEIGSDCSIYMRSIQYGPNKLSTTEDFNRAYLLLIPRIHGSNWFDYGRMFWHVTECVGSNSDLAASDDVCDLIIFCSCWYYFVSWNWRASLIKCLTVWASYTLVFGVLLYSNLSIIRVSISVWRKQSRLWVFRGVCESCSWVRGAVEGFVANLDSLPGSLDALVTRLHIIADENNLPDVY